jgi:hypothetical protein
MAYALMALVAVREIYRHIAKIVGWEPRYRPIRNHIFNGVFALSVLTVALGGMLRFDTVSTIGWVVCGGAILGGTTVPCGWPKVNNTPSLWAIRQLFFVALGVGVLVYAFAH